VVIQSCIGAINKIAYEQGGGRYTFAPTSALAMAEFTKFCLSFYFHVSDFGSPPDSAGKSFSEKFPAAKTVAMRSINVKAIASISVLGGLYCANNQLAFFLNVGADPGTIFLFKSGSTIITAVLLRFAPKRAVSEMQWVAILMQVCGLVTVQFDPCKGRLDLPNYLYGWMAIGVFMTALNAVCNDKLLKDIPMSMHVQNMILYGGGCAMNVLCFNILPNPVGDGSIGFFEGYDNIWACLVILFNAMIGIAISAVYKYCDAVVKTFATAAVTIVMVVFSAVYLDKTPTITASMGVIVVICSTWIYSKTGPAAKPKPPVPPPTDSDNDMEGLLSKSEVELTKK